MDAFTFAATLLGLLVVWLCVDRWSSIAKRRVELDERELDRRISIAEREIAIDEEIAERRAETSERRVSLLQQFFEALPSFLDTLRGMNQPPIPDPIRAPSGFEYTEADFDLWMSQLEQHPEIGVVHDRVREAAFHLGAGKLESYCTFLKQYYARISQH